MSMREWVQDRRVFNVWSQPTIRIAHRTSTTQQGAVIRHQFETWPIGTDRPPSGSVIATSPCGTCGADLSVKVRSVRATQVRLVAWMVLGLACALAFAATVRYFVTAPVVDEFHPVDRPPDWLLFLGIFGAPVGAIAFLLMRKVEDGVKISGRRAGHGLRWPSTRLF
jgi:hypothetical protein